MGQVVGVVVGWVIAGAVARASGVHVDDSVGCLDPEVVELELRTTIGDEVVDRVDLRVKLAGAEHWRLELEVLDGRGSLWNRTVAVEPVDCPFLTELVTQSVERGLADLPGWDFAFRRPPAELAFVIAATLPWSAQIALGGDLWIPVSGAFQWDTQADLVYGLLREYRNGTAQLTATTLSTGPALTVPVGSGALRLASRIGGGASLTVGGGTDDSRTVIQPRALVATDLGWAWLSGLRTAVRLELPIVRLEYEGGGAAPVLEPPLRVGIVLGIAGPLRSR